MTFNYCKFDDTYIIKHQVNMEEEQIRKMYEDFLNLYGKKRSICLRKEKIFFIHNTADTIIRNFEVNKHDNLYEISYDMYDYPKICKIIDKLLCEETFKEGYEDLVDALLITRQDLIDTKRAKMDREIRFLNVRLENENYTRCVRKIRELEKEIEQLVLSFDVNLANDAKKVYDMLDIEIISQSIVDYNSEKIYQKVKKN